MSQYITPAVLDGLFKEVYAKDLQNLIPDFALLAKEIKFSESERTGNFYHQPVKLSHSHGFTYALDSDGAFSLNDAIALTIKDAQIQGAQVLLRDAMSYVAAARAANGGAKSFMSATELMVKNMMESMSKRLELELLYGQVGLGKVGSTTNNSATSTDLILSAASWSCGIWAGMENAQIDVYQGGSKLNSTGPVTISQIDFGNRMLIVTAAAGDITAIDAGVFPLDVFFVGQKDKQMAGIDKIVTNSSSLFGIDASVYNLWKGNTYSAGGGQLTMDKVIDAVADAVKCGGLMEDVKVLVSPETWKDLHSDEAALRSYDSSYSSNESERGVKAIKYFGQNGLIEVVSHGFVKEGEAFILPMKRLKRIGAQDVSFKTPGRGDEIFLQLPSNAGYELRLYTHQAVFCESPAKLVKINNIVNG